MFEKYQKRTYPEYFQPEESETDKEVLKSTLKCKKATYINPKKYSDAVFQPDCVFTEENKNISFYESDSNNSYKDKKNKSLHHKNFKSNYDSDAISNSKNSLQKKNIIQEQFTYNYTNIEENPNNNKKNIQSNQRICLDSFLRQKSNQVPKRTIKAYQNQFDVEKSDNFNVLSYRPEDYDSNYIKTDSKSKIIQIFKKEDAGELFFPSKHQPSQSPPSSNNSSAKKEQLLSYQTPTLKLQSFFGSYTKKNHPKNNNNQAKSISKRKINQLEDFNIEKLIEIGDNFSKMKSILSFGKKINNIKNKNKIKNNNNKYYNEKEKNINKLKTKKNINENQIKKRDNLPLNIYNSQNYQENAQISDNNNDTKIVSKKMVYHGQIKRIKNFTNNSSEINNQNEINKEANQNPLISNVKNKLMNNNINNNTNNNKIFSTHSYNNNIINNNVVYNNSPFKNNNNTNTNNPLKFKKTNKKQINNNKELNYNNNQGSQQDTPQKPPQKKIFSMHLNDRFNYSINTYDNMDNGFNYNNITNNHTSINIGNKTQNDLSKKMILTEKDSNYNGKSLIKPSNQSNIQKPLINSLNKNENGNGNKKFNKFSNNNQSKILFNKGFKGKNYYGYDERHNLEGVINNHSYYVSLYSKKKINQNNYSTDKIN